MCDYAVGLSRQLNGSIIPSERKTFLPLVISFFMPLKTTSLLYIKKEATSSAVKLQIFTADLNI
jgi:hypothetical protein